MRIAPDDCFPFAFEKSVDDERFFLGGRSSTTLSGFAADHRRSRIHCDTLSVWKHDLAPIGNFSRIHRAMTIS